MTPELMKELQVAATAMAQAHQDLARALRRQSTAHELLEEAFNRLRLALTPREDPAAYLADDPELKAAVVPEQTKAGQPPRPEGRGWGLPAATDAPLEVPIPWDHFFTLVGVLPVHAVELIRQELPDALQPRTDAERADWPKLDFAEGTPAHVVKAATDNERMRAASKLRSLQGDQAVAAQNMIRRLVERERQAGKRKRK
jgi:hypothetical protein